MFTICSLYVHYMFTIYSLYVHYMFTIVHYCSLYIHHMATRNSFLPDFNEKLYYSIVQFVIKCDKHTYKKHSENQT